MSFASHERLMNYLGVIPGAVTPLAALNDSTHAVEVVLDTAILQDELVNVHPLHNAATTTLSPQGLIRFLEAVEHPPKIIDLDPLSQAVGADS